MNPRKATVSLVYNGVNATDPIAPDLDSFTFVDVASGSSDSINAEFTDRDHRWIDAWFPVQGDTLQPTILTENWEADGETSAFPCGTFHVDDFSFSGGPPIKLSLEGLALPTASSFKTTERTITYEDATLQEIGQEVADRAGIALFYEAGTVSIARAEQSNQTDCDFFSKLVGTYGLALKIYNDKLVVFSEATYEEKPPKLTLTPEDFEPGWSWNMKMVGTYTGIKYQYTDSEKNKTYTVEAGEGPRILTSNEPADNLTEATAIALAALNEANKGTVTMKITLKAKPGLIAGDCVEVKGLGKLDGKYYIDQISHSVGSGYKMALEIRRVEKRFTEATKVSSTTAEAKKKK